MSFSSEAKAELCRRLPERSCCALAECCGILTWCSEFSLTLIRIITAHPEFSRRLPALFRRVFDLTFDVLPSLEKTGKKTFLISDPEKLRTVFRTFGLDPAVPFPVHVNFALLEEDCCRAAFLRGAFLAGGSVTDPARRNHLELSTSHRTVARETCSILRELNFRPGESTRQGNTLLYLKQADSISDFLTVIGAPVTSLTVQTAKVEREMRNRITRQINCDSANADRTVSAAQTQINAIRQYSARYGLNTLPESLQSAALLRVTNPEASLADLAKLSFPPVTKSCLSHRLNRILALASEELDSPESGEDDCEGI